VDALGQRPLVTIADRAGRTADTVEADSPSLLRWSPDQHAILVPLLTGATDPAPAARILRIAVDQRTGRTGRRDTILVAAGMRSQVSYDYSADGRALVYAAQRPGPFKVRLWTRDANGGAQRDTTILTTADPARVVILPEGDRVLLRQRLPGAERQWQWSIGRFGMMPEEFRPVTSPLPKAYQQIASDRSALYLLEWDTTTATRIRRFPLEGGVSRVVASRLPAVTALAPGPAGSILVVLRDGAELRLLDSLGNERWRDTLPDSLGRVATMFPIADGTGWVGIAQPLDLSTGPDGNVRVPILRLAAADGRVSKAMELHVLSIQQYAISPDNVLHLAYSTAQEQAFIRYRVPITGGRPVREGRTPPGGCSVSRDARHWACVESDQLSDIFLVHDLPGLH
jgi:hypothetical protein